MLRAAAPVPAVTRRLQRSEVCPSPDDAVRRCVVRAVAQLSFPKPPTGLAQPVTVPVMLQAEDAVARPEASQAPGR